MFNQTTARVAQPSFYPDTTSPFGLPVFETIQDALNVIDTDDAVHVLYPRVIANAAQVFLKGFPGTVLYAVKANPHPAVLRVLEATGVSHFDVASIREIDLVLANTRDAKLFLMHPVKSRKTIRHAYANGVRDFSFDCEAELQKIVEETHGAQDLNLHLRLALPKSGGSAMPLDGKFGASFDDAVELLMRARNVAQGLGICFHVGSQCMEAASYRRAVAYVRTLVDTAGVAIDSLDCGGGFPVAYPGMQPAPMGQYFDVIEAALAEFAFDNIVIFGEPGRALCAEGGSTLARVELRKGNDLYLNDGSYGSLFDAAQCSWKYPVKSRANRTSDVTSDFRFYGPTCDSLDVMNGPFTLPADTQEGDWIEICHLGAYGQALTTEFNGFYSDTTIAVLTED